MSPEICNRCLPNESDNNSSGTLVPRTFFKASRILLLIRFKEPKFERQIL